MERAISFLSPGSCLACGRSTLSLVSNEETRTSLNSDGVLCGEPVCYLNESFLSCESCGSTFEYMKHGFFYIPMTQEMIDYQLNKIIANVAKNPFSL